MNGNQWSFTLKMTIKRMPVKKVGKLNPRNANVVENWSKSEYCLTAESTPIGIAINRPRMKAEPTIPSVTPSRPKMYDRTELREVYETPQLPLMYCLAHFV